MTSIITYCKKKMNNFLEIISEKSFIIWQSSYKLLVRVFVTEIDMQDT